MKLNHLILNSLIMCIFCNCNNKEPEACFKVISENPKVGLPVKFLNCSKFGRGTAFWDFGDSTNILRNQMPEIEHTFNKSGTYEVTLEVFQSGKNAKFTKTLTVL